MTIDFPQPAEAFVAYPSRIFQQPEMLTPTKHNDHDETDPKEWDAHIFSDELQATFLCLSRDNRK